MRITVLLTCDFTNNCVLLSLLLELGLQPRHLCGQRQLSGQRPQPPQPQRCGQQRPQQCGQQQPQLCGQRHRCGPQRKHGQRQRQDGRGEW
jgi:hypothetical protein